MIENEFGIETVDAAIGKVVDLAMDVIEKAEGGITTGEAFSIALQNGDDVIWVVSHVKDFKNEWDDMDSDERIIVIENMKARLDMPDERKIERVIEAAFVLIMNLEKDGRELVAAIKDLKA